MGPSFALEYQVGGAHQVSLARAPLKRSSCNRRREERTGARGLMKAQNKSAANIITIMIPALPLPTGRGFGLRVGGGGSLDWRQVNWGEERSGEEILFLFE